MLFSILFELHSCLLVKSSTNHHSTIIQLRYKDVSIAENGITYYDWKHTMKCNCFRRFLIQSFSKFSDFPWQINPQQYVTKVQWISEESLMPTILSEDCCFITSKTTVFFTLNPKTISINYKQSTWWIFRTNSRLIL